MNSSRMLSYNLIQSYSRSQEGTFFFIKIGHLGEEEGKEMRTIYEFFNILKNTM